MKTPNNCPTIEEEYKNGGMRYMWWWHPIEGFSCEGYQKSRIDDEPCDDCMSCDFCIFNDGDDLE